MLLLAPPAAQAAIPAEQDDCLGCHTPDAAETMKLPSGEQLLVAVEPAAFAKSVHGDKLRCVDCHADKNEYPHDSKPFQSRRDLAIANYEQCKKCHFQNYTKTVDGVHYKVMAAGNAKAALCTDCHPPHDMSRPTEPRARISATCARCHQGEYETYGKSVHGAALAAGSADVPVCTDCHRAHDIADPRDGSLALRTPEMCGTCHTNAKLMKKYNLSTKVVSTYLTDFHGMSATLQKDLKRGEGVRIAAVCTDCHGVHDIRRVRDPESRVVKANLVKTCQKCHPDATENFPAAWLSHYEPSLEKAGVVYAVELFYRVLIPFMVVGLVLQIALHLWRVVVNR
jgi:predicted CXXCH cytochrome family protein